MKIKITKPVSDFKLVDIIPVGSVVDVLSVTKTENDVYYEVLDPRDETSYINVPSEFGELITYEVPYNDPVNHPSHYADGRIEVIDYIEDKNLGFHLGNAVKYISRAGKKDKAKTAEDIRKAIWYLERYLKSLGGKS